MRYYNEDILLSASDLVKFLGCNHATRLDINQIFNPITFPDEDPQLLLLQEMGIAHERSFLQSLMGRGLTITEIPSPGSLEHRVILTREAMRSGVQVIYQGAFLAPPWHGYSDFLLRVDNSPSRLGSYSYEVADTKLSRNAKPSHILQLCLYSDLLAQEQGVHPTEMHVILGDKEKTKYSRRVSDFFHYYSNCKQRLIEYVEDRHSESDGDPCNSCSHCRWATYCIEQWESVDHLSFVAGISRSQRAKLCDVGISTMDGLSNVPEKTKIPKIQNETLNRLISQSKLQVAKRNDGKDRVEVLPLIEGKGFNRLPKPSSGDLFFDMEGDPLFEEGLEYLFGFITINTGKPVFTPFWGHSRDEEKIAFEDSVDFIMSHLNKFPDAHIYHYASYEESALKRLAMSHGTKENEIDNILRQRKLVDLYKVVRESIRTSEPAYSIKNLEVFYADKRGGDVKTAGDSIVWYEQWRKTNDNSLLQQISDYNEFDCVSTLQCRDWLLTLRPDLGVNWFSVQPDETQEGAEKEDARKEAEAYTTALKEALIANAHEGELHWRKLLGNLLEFHRRESKSSWWKIFARREMSEEELIDDKECIGGLILDANTPPYKEKSSTVYSFTFPSQEFKMRAGDKPVRPDTLKVAGEIVALDEDNRTLSLKIGPKAPPIPDPFSLIPAGPINADVLKKAIYRYANAILSGNRTDYLAVSAIIQNELPRVVGVAPGEPIAPDGVSLVDSTIAALCNLNNSHLIIQGPPGTGKTYTSSHAIVELLSRGKRIGVASNSHKAINNILHSIEKVAKEKGVVFRGVKKSSKEEHYLNGLGFVDDVTSNEDATAPNYQLVAGTAWLFAREEMDKTLDYLFIDEAGQVSLANVVAMGLSALNIVLVGDQMQLSQPTQGVHPEGSGRSALEHLLGEHATVPPEQGILLNVTWRMHPNICQFISDAVYDGRLIAEPGNVHQQLLIAPEATDEVLASAGLMFVPVDHDGNSQSSKEEGERILEVFQNLIGMSWMKRDGSKHEIGADDILVVTPYNMQVNLLKSMLPDDARVGTVDKFQGQEAPIVLISMATSSSDEMPRDIDFLFSQNRLNVAISRARCLSVMFASPKLLDTPCNKIDQMRLVNMFCWAAQYSADHTNLPQSS